MKLVLPALPYASDALEPHMSAQTFSFHHGKHHNAYVVKGNELLADASIDADTLEDLVKAAQKKSVARSSITSASATTTSSSGRA